MRKLLAYFVLATCVAVPSRGLAQVWLPDRADTEGPGIRMGDSLLLHPGVGLEGGYDTNALRRSAGEGAGIRSATLEIGGGRWCTSSDS